MGPVVRAQGVRKIYRNGSTRGAGRRLRSFLQDGGSLPFNFDLPPLAGVVLLVFVATAAVTVAPAVRVARLPTARAVRHLD
jgi:hypothetical protein